MKHSRSADLHPGSGTLDAALAFARQKVDALKSSAREIKSQLKQAKKAVKRAAKALRRAKKGKGGSGNSPSAATRSRVATSAKAAPAPNDRPVKAAAAKKSAAGKKASAAKKAAAKQPATVKTVRPALSKAASRRAKPVKTSRPRAHHTVAVVRAPRRAGPDAAVAAAVTEKDPAGTVVDTDWTQDEWTAGLPERTE
jgi:DNA-binding protein HU-beta